MEAAEAVVAAAAVATMTVPEAVVEVESPSSRPRTRTRIQTPIPIRIPILTRILVPILTRALRGRAGDKPKEDPDCTGGSGVTVTLAGVGGSVLPLFGIEGSTGYFVSFQSGFPWIETGVFASGGHGQGFNVSTDAFVGAYFGPAAQMRGQTVNYNPTAGGSLTLMFDPTSGRRLGGTLGAGPGLPGSSQTTSTTWVRSSGDGYRAGKRARGDC